MLTERTAYFWFFSNFEFGIFTKFWSLGLVFSMAVSLRGLFFEVLMFNFQFSFSLEKEILDRYLEVVLKGNKDGLKVSCRLCVIVEEEEKAPFSFSVR